MVVCIYRFIALMCYTYVSIFDMHAFLAKIDINACTFNTKVGNGMHLIAAARLVRASLDSYQSTQTRGDNAFNGKLGPIDQYLSED